MTTNVAFHTALSALSITGVKRVYAYEPDSVSTADIPAQYVALPTGDAGKSGDWAAVCDDHSKTRVASLVVLVEAAGQEQTLRNFANTLVMMDRVETALDGLSVGVFRDYTIKAGVVEKGGAPFWAVLAEITVRG